LGVNSAELNELRESFHFIYRAEFDNGLIEHELDHVIIGRYDGALKLDRDEVESVRWVSMDALAHEMTAHPEMFTAWFQIIFREYQSQLKL
jgi:isopentenyl-diphosphate delta-isomerase